MGDSKENKSSRPFDLAERTAVLGEAIIQFARSIRRDEISGPLIRQLVRAGTSVGANYTEADEAGSKKEFRYRISLCCREGRETQYGLRMLVAAEPEKKQEARKLWQEAKELTRIYASIHRKSE